MTIADWLEGDHTMIEREGEEWLSYKEIAELEGVHLQTVFKRMEKQEIERRTFHTPRTGPAALYIRRRDYDAWCEARAKAAEVPELPAHLANVWLPIGKAALIARRDRPSLYRAIQAGRLRAGTTTFLDPMIRLGDLADWARDANRPRPFDAGMLAELDAATRPAEGSEAA